MPMVSLTVLLCQSCLTIGYKQLEVICILEYEPRCTAVTNIPTSYTTEGWAHDCFCIGLFSA